VRIENLENFIWSVIIILIVFVVIYAQEREGKNKVRKYLEKNGCREIRITTKMFVGDKTTLTFEVDYINKMNERQKNTCIIRSDASSDGNIYWESPLQ